MISLALKEQSPVQLCASAFCLLIFTVIKRQISWLTTDMIKIKKWGYIIN